MSVSKSSRKPAIRPFLNRLYEGETPGAKRFRWALLAFDIVTIGYFIVTAFGPISTGMVVLDTFIGVVLLADFVARVIISKPLWRFLLSPVTWADIIVLLSLLAPLLIGPNFAFLRVLRALRIIRSFRIAHELRRITGDMPVNTRVVVAATNLMAFIFVVTSIVWVLEHERNPALDNYMDALYFTITTLTTTGYGDIVLSDRLGRFITIIIMVFGVGFFLNLLQAIYRPNKVEVPCPQCGLRLHDSDASHCKHCGHIMNIETEGSV
ncbi:ion channel [Notoacmeibacter ruber]|uniref:Ion transporter n=1 Tax=Notoacmeibacter ruber TaxID=2670375 RepID=A0A3L7JCE3_9HYPH|nr:ion channel [Notoacmeibacter ruber]RLQ87985.1 ion transporter [Notoacmeibacter ruber]